MDDTCVKGGEHHAGANEDPTDQDHRSAAIPVDEYAAHRSCTEERNVSLFFWYFPPLDGYSAETKSATDLLHT